MSKFKYKYIFLVSLTSLILIYSFLSVFMLNNFDFRLAETFLFLNVTKFKTIADNFSPNQIQSYIIMATSFDVIWPIAYCLFFYIINDKLLKNSKKKHLLNLYTFFIFVFDMSENFLTARYLIRPHNTLAHLSVLFTNIKWLSLFFLTIITIINLIKYLKKNSFKELLT